MITIKNLSKSYNQKFILKNLNLEIFNNEILVILGRSGTGKSVLLRHIIGLENPDKGSILINGLTVKENNKKNKTNIGMLFQTATLFESLTILENVLFSINHNNSIKNTLDKKNIALSILQDVKLLSSSDKTPDQLSGGMKKRAALACLIARQPNIILLDEPTSGLDSITTNSINQLIKKTHTALNATTLIVTHDVLSAIKIADRIAVHENGSIVQIAEKQDFLSCFCDSSKPLYKFLTSSIPKTEIFIKQFLNS